MSPTEKYAEKIAKLLRKAESTTPEEAELLVEKAQELMTQYAISEAMIDASRGVERDEIEQEKFVMTGIFRRGLAEILWTVLKRNDCKAVMVENIPQTIDGRTYKQTVIYTATGFRSDLDRSKLLYASLQVQAANAQSQWYKGGGVPSWYSKNDNHRARREFLFGFARAVDQRLMTADRAAREAAEQEHAERTEVSLDEAKESVALVLRSRKDRVEDWFDQKYGDSLRSARTRYSRGDSNANAAGYSAGQRADLGQTGISGRGALPR